jgi:hypothetical protein
MSITVGRVRDIVQSGPEIEAIVGDQPIPDITDAV